MGASSITDRKLQGRAMCVGADRSGENDFDGGAGMTGKSQFVGLIFFVFILLLGGCGWLSGVFKGIGGQKVDEVEKTPAEREKAKLLKSIDRKYENADAHFELGRLYQADGLWAKAENHYKIALNFDPVHREAQAARIKVLMGIGDTTKAELLAEEYIGQASNRAADSLRLALAFQEQELDDYALTCYQQALRLAPNSAKINRQIGYYYLSRNEQALAQDYLTRSFQLNPDQAEVAGELGRLGVAVKIPRKIEKRTKKLDKMVEESEK